MSPKKQKICLFDKTIIDVCSIVEPYIDYPKEFWIFSRKHQLNPPRVNSASGQGLALLLHHPQGYATREVLTHFFRQIGIKTRDPIQAVNKTEQWGLKRGKAKGIYFIPAPYQVGHKHKMRYNFQFQGSAEEKENAINAIKEDIRCDYLEVSNDKWQLGHRNPDKPDSSSRNLVLQPPIQAKYRDDYVFIDTLTKMPMPKKLMNNNYIDQIYTEEQQKQLLEYLINKHGIPGK